MRVGAEHIQSFFHPIQTLIPRASDTSWACSEKLRETLRLVTLINQAGGGGEKEMEEHGGSMTVLFDKQPPSTFQAWCASVSPTLLPTGKTSFLGAKVSLALSGRPS